MDQNYTYLKIDAEMRSMIPPTIEKRNFLNPILNITMFR